MDGGVRPPEGWHVIKVWWWQAGGWLTAQGRPAETEAWVPGEGWVLIRRNRETEPVNWTIFADLLLWLADSTLNTFQYSGVVNTGVVVQRSSVKMISNSCTHDALPQPLLQPTTVLPVPPGNSGLTTRAAPQHYSAMGDYSDLYMRKWIISFGCDPVGSLLAICCHGGQHIMWKLSHNMDFVLFSSFAWQCKIMTHTHTLTS